MRYLKEMLRPLNTKEEGSTVWVMGLFSICFLMVMACYCLQLETYKVTSDYLEDALAESGLASALIDIEQYGIDHSVVIEDAKSAYDVYAKTLKTNLNLNDDKSSNSKLIFSNVVIDRYHIFNVFGDEIQEIEMDGAGNIISDNMRTGTVCAPNGQTIEETSIYSEISFNVRGFLGIEIMAHKGKLVEVESIVR